MQITEAESVVMHALWDKSPQAAEDVSAALAERHWQDTTVKTLLNRLLRKGAIAAARDGRRFLYRPVLRREDYVLTESTSLLDRLFGGRVAPLVQQFSERRKLSKRDIAELRRLIDELDP